ncbi:tRNA_anti-like family protein [Synechococcus sp. BIOS-E4-1]|uniref:hypothetical protein n=1 Tax=Synechococcus sp. BIOS-E4-1 TaxID=1400864 RepID=UPI0016467D68|nr:hypothetical protein [Synechococcus sp. BIOS-E4-1]QNI53368.1 tRNA_anti-like family protein [Synechococcus sp. BIOS-E4-1]
MKKFIALGIFLSLTICACDTNQTQPDRPEAESQKESPKESTSSKPVEPGKGTFQKKGGELETFDITVHDRGHKKFYGEGDAPIIVIDWSDGYSSAYLFGLDNTGLVYDYDPKSEKWGKDGAKMEWGYLGNNISITSESGAKTVLGGVSEKLKPMLASFKDFQKQQTEAYEARQKQQKMYTDMDLGQLDTEFKQNRIRARRNYENRVITVRGEIDAIYDDHMTLCQSNSGECISLPYGYLEPGLENWLADRSQGDRATVTGTLQIDVALGVPTFRMGRWKIVSGYSNAPLSLD